MQTLRSKQETELDAVGPEHSEHLRRPFWHGSGLRKSSKISTSGLVFIEKERGGSWRRANLISPSDSLPPYPTVIPRHGMTFSQSKPELMLLTPGIDTAEETGMTGARDETFIRESHSWTGGKMLQIDLSISQSYHHYPRKNPVLCVRARPLKIAPDPDALLSLGRRCGRPTRPRSAKR